ncbi:hypothetical protein [Glutamicibacter nicotianae]
MQKNDEPVSKKLYLLILILLIAVAAATVFFTPILPQDFQSVVGSTVGSIVGTALAFLGAVWLWVKEQRKLAADEAERESKLLTEEIVRKRKDQIKQHQSRDKELLREAHATVGSLIAFNYHDTRLDPASIALQKRLLQTKLTQTAALIHDDALRQECEFINDIAASDSDLIQYLSMDVSSRLYTAQGWYVRLISLPEHSPVSEARPPHYARLKKAVDEWYDYLDQQYQAQMEWEEEQRKNLKNTNDSEEN